MSMMLSDLKRFLALANKAGYASGNRKSLTKEKDHSTTIRFKSGFWEFHDNYFGGEPYGGREIISYKNQPVWIMVYYGLVTNSIKPEKIYPFLQKALGLFPVDYPYRGPAIFEEDGFIYKNNWSGEIESFSGKEIIIKDNKEIYSASYIGGLIDRRKEV
jgi:hypothetical protein